MNEPTSSLPHPWFTNIPGVILKEEGYQQWVVGREAYLAQECGVTLETYMEYISSGTVLLPILNVPPPPYPSGSGSL